MNYFISAIGTDSGKTLFSAIMVEALKADYWKPVQAGIPTDTSTVKSLISNTETNFHPEGCLLNTPASPHAAARLEDITLKAAGLIMPVSNREIIIEGAGGLMVPINDNEYIADLPQLWRIPVILVANLYLGSINHTLLSIEYLKNKNLEVRGIVFNGEPNDESERIILQQSGYKLLLRIPKMERIDKMVVMQLAKEFLKNWNE
jgi:dethiobiotin synthetase